MSFAFQPDRNIDKMHNSPMDDLVHHAELSKTVHETHAACACVADTAATVTFASVVMAMLSNVL